MLKQFKAAAIQMDTHIGDKAYNLSRMHTLMQEAREQHGDIALYVFPELVTTGYECAGMFEALSEPIGGESMQKIGAFCRALNACAVYGFILNEGGRLYNALALLGSDGAPLGIYKKVHLFEEERAWFSAGDAFPVFDSPLSKIGMLVCWDLAFPEAARSLALNGAELIATGSAWEAPYEKNYTLAARMRAYENCLPLIASNRVGAERSNTFIGMSAVYRAGGEPLAMVNDGDGAAVAELCEEECAKLREGPYPFLKSRVPEAYTR